MTEQIHGDTKTAVAFLQDVRKEGQHTLAAISPEGGAPIVSTFVLPRDRGRMHEWISERNGTHNLYFMPNRTKIPFVKKPKEEDIAFLDFAHVDIDPLPNESPSQCHQRAKATLNALSQPPTHVWRTGNGAQALWCLEEPMEIGDVDDASWGKAINVGLIRALGGKACGVDSCQNLDRLLRLPGTVNLPDDKKRAKGRQATLSGDVEHYAERTYSLFDFPIVDSGKATINDKIEVGDPEFVDDLAELNLPERTATIVELGRVPGETKNGDDSRSVWEAEAIFGMCRSGIPDEKILGILLDDRFEIGSRVREKPNPETYGRKEVERLRRRHNEDIVVSFDGLKQQLEDNEFREFTADQFEGQKIPDQSWVVRNFVVGRDVSLAMGDGGAGKTTLMLQLSVSVTSGQPWLEMPVTKGKVLYFSGEESADVMHRRLNDIINGASSPYQNPPLTWRDLADLKFIDRSEQDALLATQSRDLRVTATAVYHALEEKIEEWRPTLVVFDSLYDIFGGDENAKAPVKQFVNLMRRLARRHDTAIVIIGHPSLTGMNTGSGTSGSTAWNNAARSRFYLTGAKDKNGNVRDPDLRQLKSMKQNYGRLEEAISLDWQNGVYVVFKQDEAAKRAMNDLAKTTFLQMLDQYNEENRAVSHKPGPSYAPTTFANDHRSNGFDKRTLKDAMDMLLADKTIESQTFGPPSKERTRLIRANH